MRHIYRGAALALFVATLPLAAMAEEAYTLRDVDVFAGPSSEFPPVAQLPPGTQVQLADVRNLLATGCDVDYLQHWTRQLGLDNLLNECLR